MSLCRAHFTLAKDSYATASLYLRHAVQGFPELMYIRIEPSGFYGKPGDFKAALARLVAYAKANPTNADSHFVLGYLMWRERDMPAARAALDVAAKHAQNKELAAGIKAVRTGMARSKAMLLTRAPKLGEPIDLPCAGVRLALPVGFKPQRLSDINQVLKAVSGGAGGTKNPQTLALSIYRWTRRCLWPNCWTSRPRRCGRTRPWRMRRSSRRPKWSSRAARPWCGGYRRSSTATT